MATGALSTTLRDPAWRPSPARSVMSIRMRMQTRIKSVLFLHQRMKNFLASGDQKLQTQVTFQTLTLRQTGPSHCPCQHQKRRCDSRHRQSRLTWFLLTSLHRALARMRPVVTQDTPQTTTPREEGLIAITVLDSAQKPGTPVARPRM